MAERLEVQSGAVIVDHDPYYYVDLVNGDDGRLIVAYELSKKSKETYRETGDPKFLSKAGRVEFVEVTKFNKDNSELSKHLSLRPDNKQRKQIVKYKPAIFTAPVEYGTDSVTGNYGLGFPEMRPESLRGPVNGRYQTPEETGVFIGLNNIKWLKDVYDFKQWEGYLRPIYDVYINYYNVSRGLLDGGFRR